MRTLQQYLFFLFPFKDLLKPLHNISQTKLIELRYNLERVIDSKYKAFIVAQRIYEMI